MLKRIIDYLSGWFRKKNHVIAKFNDVVVNNQVGFLVFADSETPLSAMHLTDSDGKTLDAEFKRFGPFVKVWFRQTSETVYVTTAPVKNAESYSEIKILNVSDESYKDSAILDFGMIARFGKRAYEAVHFIASANESPIIPMPIRFKIGQDFLEISDFEVVDLSRLRAVVKQTSYWFNLKIEFVWTLYHSNNYLKLDVGITNTADSIYSKYSNPTVIPSLSMVCKGLPWLKDSSYTSSLEEFSIGSVLNINCDYFNLIIPDFNELGMSAKTEQSSGELSVNFIDKESILYGKQQKAFTIYLGKGEFHKESARPSIENLKKYFGFAANSLESKSKVKTYLDRLRAVGYEVEVADTFNQYQAKSIYEYIYDHKDRNFGWQNYGDIWVNDSFCNLHYDLPYCLYIEYLRSGNEKALILASIFAKFRATLGQIHGTDSDAVHSFFGLAVYEKNNHGDYAVQTPRYTHNWIEGLYLHSVLNDDYFVELAAKKASFGLLNFNDVHFGTAIDYNEPRWIGWTILALCVSYEYTNDSRYLAKAVELCKKYIAIEVEFGSKGYFIPKNAKDIQPWMYAGYTMLGIIRLYEITKDQEILSFIKRSADWVINKVLKQGQLALSADKNNRVKPVTSSYWLNSEDNGEVIYAMFYLPVLIKAAETCTDAFNEYAAEAFEIVEDLALRRDLALSKDGFVEQDQVHFVNFVSLAYPGSPTKVYGQTCLFTESALKYFEREGIL